MSENNQIKPGDVVCLKADEKNHDHKTLTTGTLASNNGIHVHWMFQGEVKSAIVNRDSLHKIR